jgi:protein-S-isoprenylcysteine O-methyltransferase Ste14
MQEQKDAAAVRIFPPGVPVLVVVLGAALQRLLPIEFLTLPTPLRYWLGGALVASAVLGLGLPSVLLFRRGGQDENPWKPTPHIEERGPFRFTRNPMYLQMVLVGLGAGIVLMNWWILGLSLVGGAVLQRFAILPEEAYLERKFGDSYLSYKRRVRRWI